MTNKFQIQNFQLFKQSTSSFEVLDFKFWYLFDICFLCFGNCLKHNFYSNKNLFRLW